VRPQIRVRLGGADDGLHDRVGLPGPRVAGILINRWRSDRLDRAVWRQELHNTYGSVIIDHPLPEREVVAVAATNRVPVPRREAYDYVASVEAVARHVLTNQGKETAR